MGYYRAKQNSKISELFNMNSKLFEMKMKKNQCARAIMRLSSSATIKADAGWNSTSIKEWPCLTVSALEDLPENIVKTRRIQKKTMIRAIKIPDKHLDISSLTGPKLDLRMANYFFLLRFLIFLINQE